MLKAQHIVKRYPYQPHAIIQDFTYTFPSHGLIFITGVSGSGKTTLLKVCSGQEEINEGDLFFQHRSIRNMTEKEKMDFRLFRCGFVDQECRLFLDLSIEENLQLLCECHPQFSKKTKQNRRIRQVCKEVCLSCSPSLMTRNLSGGEKQRVAIARAILFSPSILFCDEPTGALDAATAIEVMELLKKISRKCLVLIVSHDATFAKRYADKELHLTDGKIQEIDNRNVMEKEHFLDPIPPRKRPFRFLFHYVFQHMKNRKYRTFISSLFLALGISVGGMGSLFAHSIKKEMQTSFSTMMDQRQFQIYTSSSSIEEERISMDEREIAKIIQDEKQLLGRGVYYTNRWEKQFPDRDECRIVSTPIQAKLPWITMQSINSYFLLKEIPEEKCYCKKKELALDEIILGMTPSQFISFLSSLSLPSMSFSQCGEYLLYHEVRVAFFVENKEWGYRDEQIFTIRGVAEMPFACVIHSYDMFNAYIFEERMRFDSTYSWYGDVAYPWTLRKRTFVYAEKECLSYLETNWKYASYLVDWDKEVFSHHFFKRYIISQSNQNYLSFFDIEQIVINHPEIQGCLFGMQEGYQVIAETILHGIQGYFYFAKERKELDGIEDSYPSFEQYVLPPAQVQMNTILSPTDSSFSFIPWGEETLGISTALSKSLSLKEGDTLSILYVNPLHEPHFVHQEWKISKTIKSNQPRLYLSMNFLRNFFLYDCHITPSSLRPITGLLYTQNAKEVPRLLANLQRLYPQYHFASPNYDFMESIQKATKNMSVGMGIFALWFLIYACILIRIIIHLYFMEMKDDILYMEKLGIGEKIDKWICRIVRVFFWLFSLLLTICFFVFLYFLSTIQAVRHLLPYSLSFSVSSLWIILFLSFSIFLFPMMKDKKRRKK